MKTEKACKEAVLRAHQSTEESTQAQEELLHMKEQLNNPAKQLHESPKNLMRSWQSLRHLDQDLAETKYSDLADDPDKTNKEKRSA